MNNLTIRFLHPSFFVLIVWYFSRLFLCLSSTGTCTHHLGGLIQTTKLYDINLHVIQVPNVG